MSDEKASYGQVRGRLTEAEAVAAALRKGQVDAVVTERSVLFLRLKDAEEEAKKLLKAIETTKEAICLLSLDLAITYANNAMCNLFGYKHQEMIGKHVSTFNAGPYSEVTAKQIASTIEKQGWWEGEIVNKRKDGTKFTSYSTVSAVKDKGGEITSFVSTQHDITERIRAEGALQRSERELTIRNRIADIFLTTPDNEMYGEVLQVLLEVMESKYGIFGYIDEAGALVCASMTRDVWEQCQVPDKTIVFPREKWGGIWGRALIEKRSLYANEGLHVPEGHVPITKVLVVPVMYGGRVIGLLEVANKPTDYSHKDREFLETIGGKIAPILNARLQRDRYEKDRKQAEEALKRSEERYALAQRGANIGSWDWNILTGELIWSEQIEPMFGFSKGEFKKTYQAFLDCVHPEDRQYVVDSVNACVAEGRDYAIEHRIVWPDGIIRWVSETGDVIRDENGKGIRMLGIVQDITERKAAERRLLLGIKILEVINQKGRGEDVIGGFLELVKEFTGFEAVGIRLREEDDFPYFKVNGFSEDFVRAENYLCARDDSGEIIYDSQGRPVLECVCGSVILGNIGSGLPCCTEGGSFWTNSTTELLERASLEGSLSCTRNYCNQAGYESVALIPLRSGQEVVGLLQLNDRRLGRFTLDMIRFFEGIGDSIGIALARMNAEEDIKNLAKFPSEDPYPVLRVAKDGTILYANTAGSELLKDWDCEVGARAPEHWCQYVLRILKSGSSEELEVACKNRIFSLIIAPIVDMAYVNVYGIDITRRKQAEEDLRQYRHHLEELVEERTEELTEANKKLLEEIEERKRLEKEILSISEREQRRIGQELHDSLGQQLTGIALMSKVLEQKLTTKSPEEAADVAEIGKLVSQATGQARGLAKGLHPVGLDADSLTFSLKELAVTTENLFGVRCTFKGDEPAEIDDTELAVHLYRITQEAITNAIKHSKAKNIQIVLSYGTDKSVLTVRSDGLGFPKSQAESRGMGLRIMNHRAEMIDATLDIRRGSEGGTLVICAFPNKKYQ